MANEEISGAAPHIKEPFSKTKWFKLTLWISVLSGLLVTGVLYGETRIRSYAAPRLFSDVRAIPTERVGLVMGTASGSRSGGANLYFVNRMNAAAELYHSGKVEHLLLSGDNRYLNYNEPKAMRKALMASGVDSTHITLDFAGFSTFDSVVRAKKVFGLSRFTVISQRFQNERALWIADQFGIDAIGFDAEEVGAYATMYTWVRERGARLKMWYDLCSGAEPHFLGEPITIGEQVYP